MIRAVLMDVDNTILDFEKCSRWALYSAANKMDIFLPENTFPVFMSVSDKLWKEYEDGKITREEIFEIRWKVVFSVVGLDADAQTFDRYFLKYLGRSTEQVNGARDILKYLSERCDVYTASNGIAASQKNRLEEAGLLGFLTGTFTSESIGYAKPQAGFYRYCLDNMEIRYPPHEILAVGDSVRADIEGAKAFGIQTCLFDRKGIYDCGECPADFVIRRLEELKEIV